MSDVLTCIAGSQLAATQSSVTRPLSTTVKPNWTVKTDLDNGQTELWLVEERRGKKGEPYAVRTSLGWSLIGPTSSHGNERSFSINHVMVSNAMCCKQKNVNDFSCKVVPWTKRFASMTAWRVVTLWAGRWRRFNALVNCFMRLVTCLNGLVKACGFAKPFQSVIDVIQTLCTPWVWQLTLC